MCKVVSIVTKNACNGSIEESKEGLKIEIENVGTGITDFEGATIRQRVELIYQHRTGLTLQPDRPIEILNYNPPTFVRVRLGD